MLQPLLPARRHAGLVRLALLLALLLVTLSPVLNPVKAADVKKITLTTGKGDLPTLDAALTEDTSSTWVINHTHYALVRGLEDDLANTQPGMAEKWSVSPDGLTYTFTIRQGVPWVKWDGKQVVEVKDDAGKTLNVTAKDFEYAIKRTIDPATASNYAYVFVGFIKNSEAFNSAKETGDALNKLRDAVGVKATDDQTLVITLEQPAAYALGILGLVNLAATPKAAIDQFGAKWTEPGNAWSYGPYVVSEWKHDESLTMVKNPFWKGFGNSPAPKIDQVTFLFLDDTPTFNNYEAGTVDAQLQPPLTELDRIKADPTLSKELTIGPSFSTYYFGFNVTKAPFDDARVRRAFSYALDRQAIIDNVTKGDQEPALWFSRPGLAAAPTLKDSPKLGIGYDPEMAKKELQAYLDEKKLTADQLPPITIMVNQVEGHVKIAEAAQQMWQDVLGVNVTLSQQEWKVFLQTLDSDPPQMFRAGWNPDYADANNFLRDVFRSTSTQNHTKWKNAEFDKLVDEAAKLNDTAKRVELYRQAEDILVVKDAAIIPVYWYTRLWLTKPYVERTFAVSNGDDRIEKWDVKPH
ncbi:MAG: peptide ABC transporter substrate-binding protein [Anaerolineae bacterium]|nr:peptide ABC transporter substrate-binding protein [Anaerolineae bacterium]